MASPFSLDMLEVRKNTFSKNYENSFFREFSRNLYKLFKERNLTGVLIGSPFCEADERLQIDALLITNSVVCIIDFKNFKGKIKLPAENNFELGWWTTEEGEQIKGGSSINPFIQLKNQKRRFTEVAKKFIQSEITQPNTFNPAHIVRIVCFQDKVELIGKIPATESLNFFILHKENFIEGILDVIDVTDKEVILNEESFKAFKKVFRADPFKFDEKTFEDNLKDVASKSAKLDYSTLHDDQRTALTQIKSFLENPDQQIFILQGTTNSGKSYLIPFIIDIAYTSNIYQTEIFAVSSRVANNLLSSSGIENVNSIYSFIYGGQKSEIDKKEEADEKTLAESEEQEISEEFSPEIIQCKKCDNSENALFIVDESQLVSDSLYQSIDLIFGSGHLLKDLIYFTEFDKSKRKIIFIGDPYQIHIGKTDESPLNPTYLENKYKLKTACFQLFDKEHFSDINEQALRCVKSIRSKSFNSLRFNSGKHFFFLKKDHVSQYVSSIITNKVDGHILCFSNEGAQTVNNWIKKSIIKTGDDIAKEDLVLFKNNISVEDENDPFSEPKKIYNGQFATVTFVSENVITEKIKGDATELKFRELVVLLNETGQKVKVLSLENYRLNSKAELLPNEIIAFKRLLNMQLQEYLEENPFEKTPEYAEVIKSNNYKSMEKEIKELKEKLEMGEKVKTKLEAKERELRKLLRIPKQQYKIKIESNLRKNPSTKYYKYKNAAHLKFGWAITIDTATSYKWQEVIIDAEPGSRFSNSRTHEQYFRMMYTAITRARQRVVLHNYKPITPFDKTKFIDKNTGVKPKDIFFFSDNANIEERLSEFKQFVTNKLKDYALSIFSIDHHKNQEVFLIQRGSMERAAVSFYYKNNGKFNLHTVLKSEPNEFGQVVVNALKQKNVLTDFEFIKDSWRKLNYESLNSALNSLGIRFEVIIQTNFKDKIRLFSNENELNIEVDYSSNEMINYITAVYYSDISIWEDFKKTIEQLKE